MKWRDGGIYGLLCREITNVKGDRAVCKVWTKQFAEYRDTDGHAIEPWPEGEENFALILNAPVLLEALEAIADLPTDDLWRCLGIASAAIAAVKGEQADDR